MPAERLPRIWSSETFTTDVSMISISVGSITVKATIHLFIHFNFAMTKPQEKIYLSIIIVVTTDMPTLSTCPGSVPLSKAIFTGIL